MKRIRITEKDLIKLVKRVIKETENDYEYCLIDDEGYYFVPSADNFIKYLIDNESLIPFYRKHLINLEATKAKKEMQDMGLDEYDYPEGIETIIDCGENLLKVFETAIEAEHGERALNLVKDDALKKAEDMSDL
jgi:hypothetical protein